MLALYHKDSDQFRLERVPMPYFAALRSGVIPASAPAGTNQDRFEMTTAPLAADHVAGTGQSPATT